MENDHQTCGPVAEGLTHAHRQYPHQHAPGSDLNKDAAGRCQGIGQVFGGQQMGKIIIDHGNQ